MQPFTLLKELTEAGVRPFTKAEDATMAELAHTISTQCKIALDQFLSGKTTLYCGWGDLPPNGVYDSSTGTRKSENTSNWYTTFFDTNPVNSRYPKRSKSFICTDSEFVASEFSGDGMTFVFPFDGVDLGVIPTQDLWELEVITPSGSYSYPDLNVVIEKLSKELGETWDNWDDFYGAIESLSPPDFELIEEIVEDLGFGDQPAHLALLALRKFLKKAYSLEAQGVKVVSSVAEVSSVAAARAREVWFSGKCVIINMNDLEELQALL